MNSKPEYHFPFVAAQNQFRERYAGMTSAAMLEDLFFDALNNFVRTNEPSVQLDRPPRGEKGYDYEIFGTRISHKVSKSGATQIAALWDATKDAEFWNFETPISLTCGDYSRKNFRVSAEIEGKIANGALLTPISRQSLVKTSEALITARFGKSKIIEVIEIWHPGASGEVSDVVPFEEIWSLLAPRVSNSIPANEIELFLVPSKKVSNLEPGDRLIVEDTKFFRPGTFILRKDKLQKVRLEKNNRALLVPKSTVAELMMKSAQNGDFIPMGNWFAAYASTNPPDLYLAQRTEFDHMFQQSFSRRVRK